LTAGADGVADSGAGDFLQAVRVRAVRSRMTERFMVVLRVRWKRVLYEFRVSRFE
jgi:hypothetical protein